MCGICARFGVNIHADILSDNQVVVGEPNSISLDPAAGGTYLGKPILGFEGIISQIDSGRTMRVTSDVITYTFLDLNHLIGIYNNKNFGFTAAYGLSPFSEAQRTAARDAVTLWDDLIPQTFKESKGLGADIQFSNSLDPGQAYAYYPTKQGWKFQSDVFIADPEYNVTNKWFSPGGYGNTTLQHELGHTLGLSHPGAYNGAGATTYAAQAEYAQDSMQYSIMSYWSGAETGSVTRNWLTGQANYAQTPMLHDILTIQAKYGADTTTRTGNTTYGFNSNAGNAVYDFTSNKFPYLTIYDAGGVDTLDLSGYGGGNFVDLHAGAFSSVGAAVPTLAEVNAGRAALGVELFGTPLGPTTQALLNARIAERLPLIESKIAADTGVTGVNATQYDNLAIAYGTVIENAIGGSARDVLWGNQVANKLDGRGGDDVLNGYEGADRLTGGSGNDTFQFSHVEKGDVIVDFATGDKIDLSKIDANSGLAGDQAFVFLGATAFTNVAGQLRYDGGLLSGDVNGDGLADFTVVLANSAALTSGDMFL